MPEILKDLRLTAAQRQAAQMIAAGRSQDAIARVFHLNQSTVSRWCSLPDFKALVEYLRAGGADEAENLALGAAAANRFLDFCRFVLRDDHGNPIDPADHQIEWVEALQEIGDSPAGKKVAIIAPPGGGKTQLGIGFLSWMVGKYSTQHFALLSYADKVGWSRSAAIRNLIELSDEYHYTFPDIVPNKRAWDKSEWQVMRSNIGDPHPTLRAGGTKSAVVAYRLHGLVIDDPHDQKNAATPAQRRAVCENYDQAIGPRLLFDAWEVCIGTRWSADDFIGYRLRQDGTDPKRGGWRVIHTIALDSKKRSYWPAAYPAAFLLDKKRKTPATFAVQYQGDTTGGEEAGIIRRIATYPKNPIDLVNPEHPDYKDLLIATGIDTAFREEETFDFTVGYVGGLDASGRIWLLDRIKGHWGVPEVAREIEASWIKWAPFAVWIEDYGSGTAAIQTLMASVPSIPTGGVKYSGGTRTRAHALAQYIHGGHVLFPRSTDWLEDSKYQLTHYGFSDFDDDVDALFILVDNLLAQRHPSYYESDREGPIVRMG